MGGWTDGTESSGAGGEGEKATGCVLSGWPDAIMMGVSMRAAFRRLAVGGFKVRCDQTLSSCTPIYFTAGSLPMYIHTYVTTSGWMCEEMGWQVRLRAVLLPNTPMCTPVFHVLTRRSTYISRFDFFCSFLLLVLSPQCLFIAMTTNYPHRIIPSGRPDLQREQLLS